MWQWNKDPYLMTPQQHKQFRSCLCHITFSELKWESYSNVPCPHLGCGTDAWLRLDAEVNEKYDKTTVQHQNNWSKHQKQPKKQLGGRQLTGGKLSISAISCSIASCCSESSHSSSITAHFHPSTSQAYADCPSRDSYVCPQTNVKSEITENSNT